MRWLSLVLGIVFSVAGLKAIFAFDPATASLSRPVLLLVAASGALIFFFLFARATSNATQLSEFESWLTANSKEILSKGATYNGTRITSQTEMTQFMMTVSVIFLTSKFPSRYYVAGRDNVVFSQLACTFATLLLGWWGIPWGPIYTVQTVIKNMSGGYKISVGEYLYARQNG
jgi:hypothetical protein